MRKSNFTLKKQIKVTYLGYCMKDKVPGYLFKGCGWSHGIAVKVLGWS